MKKIKVCLIVLFLNSTIISFVFSQGGNSNNNPPLNLPVLMPTSPDVAALMKYAETNVDLSTGANTYTYSIYNIETNGFTLPVTITNSGLTIKPTEIASTVGLGWSLNTGGAITKTELNGMTLEAMNSLCNMSGSSYNAIVFPSNSHIKEKYTYNFAGISGSFFVNNNRQVINLGDPTLKIILTGNEISITNANGVEFIFGSNDIQSAYFERSSKKLGPFNLDYTLADFNLTSNSFLPEPNLAYTSVSDDYYFDYHIHLQEKSITSTLLREIRFPNSSDKIIFNYEQSVMGIEQYSLLEEYSYVPDDPSIVFNEEYIHRSFQISNTVTSYLKSIVWPNGKIEFNFTGGREDMFTYDLDNHTDPGLKRLKIVKSGGAKLSDIKIFYKSGELIKGYSFDHFYNFEDTDLKLLTRKRLLLKSITEYNSKEYASPTVFNYLLSANFAPYPSLLTNHIDYWGNYNYSSVSQTVSPNPKSRIPLMYSTLNAWNPFIYYSNVATNLNSLNLHPIHKPSTFTLVNYNNSANRRIQHHNDRTSSTSALMYMLNKIEYPTGGIDSFIYTLDTLNYFYDGDSRIIIGAGVKIQKTIRMFGNGQVNLVKNYHYNGGELLYVPQFVRSYFMASNDVEKFKPTDVYFSNPINKQSGSLVNFRQVTETIVGHSKTVYLFSTRQNDNWATNQAQNSPSYTFKSNNKSTPNILDGRVGIYGSTNYPHFVHKLDYFPYLYNDDFGYLNNKLLEEISYDLNGNIVSHKLNTYNYYNYTVPVIHHAILNDILKQRSTVSLPLSMDGLLIRCEYYFNAGHAELSSTENRIYNTNTIIATDYLKNTTFFKYNKWRQLEEETSLNSDGTENSKEYKYLEFFSRNDNNNIDATNYGSVEIEALRQLKSKNILSTIVVENRYTKKLNESKRLINSKLSIYKNNADKTVLWKEFFLSQQNPINDYVDISINQNSGVLNMDSRYKLYRTYNSYNFKNKPLEIIDRQKGVVSYKWSYDSELPVAEFINGYNSDIPLGNNTSYLGFENGSISSDAINEVNNDYWSFNTSLASIVNEAYTGRYALKVNPSSSVAFNRSFQPNINTKTLVIDGWVKIHSSASLPINTTKSFNIICEKNGTQSNNFNIITNKLPNEWKYFRVLINVENSQPTNLPIYNLKFISNVSGTSYNLVFDDIRVFPEDASVSTVTYNEILNQPTSISDANNSPTRFEYDGIGRLNFVLDYNKNILKSNVYNLKFKRN